jgi:isopenicillin-N epimerase
VAPTERPAWHLDPSIAFLNHGSFGACPIAVLEAQTRWRERMETEPIRFLARELEGHLDAVRAELGAFLAADPDGLAFVPNATTGVGSVLSSLRFRPGDALLTTDHEYNATINALRRAAERDGATMVIARVPFPIRDASDVLDAVLARVTPKTRFALISHVTSPTGLVFPVDGLVSELTSRGVDVIVDGAHAPGQVPLALDALGAPYYTGNGHKWLYSPKGSAFLWVRADRRDPIRPLVTSHGANDPRTDRSRFRLEWDWTGTADPTPWLAIPEALRFGESQEAGGWPAVMAANRSLALRARRTLAAALDIEPPQPESMVGSMVAMPLAWLEGATDTEARALEAALLDEDRIEVPITGWPVRAARASSQPPTVWLVRLSAQRYVAPEWIDRLAAALGRRRRRA